MTAKNRPEQSMPISRLPLEALHDTDIPDPLQINQSAYAGIGNAQEEDPIFGLQQRQGVVLGRVHIMIEYQEGSELAAVPAVCHIPKAPAWLLGVCNLHGDTVPLVDLSRWMSADDAARDKPMMLVLSRGADAVATVINDLPKRLRFTSEHAAGDVDMAPAMLRPHVRGSYLIDGQMWFDVRCTTLIDALEESLAQ